MAQPSTARTGGLMAVDAVVLVALRPDVGDLARAFAAPRRWVDTAGADAVAVRIAGTALWLVAAWVAVGLVAALATRLPGATGRLAAAVTTVTLPVVLRRIVAGSAGLGVLLAPAVAQAGGTHTPAPGPAASSTAPGTTPGPVWPASPAPPGSAPPTTPGPAWPGGSTPTPPPHTPRTPDPHQTPRTPTPPPHRPPHAQAPPSAGRVTVHPGECLWLLAAHRLGPTATDAELARYVPQLYAANQDVIGADPDLVVPGQVLDVPSPNRPTD